VRDSSLLDDYDRYIAMILNVLLELNLVTGECGRGRKR